MKELWALVRPYFTVARVTTAVTALLTPPLAVLIGKLCVVFAAWGIALDQTKTMVVFLGGVAATVAVVVPLVRKFLDNRTQFEQALIQSGRPDLIGGKSLSEISKDKQPTLISPGVYSASTSGMTAGVTGSSAGKVGPSIPPSVMEGEEYPTQGMPDEDYVLSQQHDVEPLLVRPNRVSPSTDPTALPDGDV